MEYNCPIQLEIEADRTFERNVVFDLENSVDDRWMEKLNVMHPCNDILFSTKTTEASYNINEAQKLYTK